MATAIRETIRPVVSFARIHLAEGTPMRWHELGVVLAILSE